MSFIENFDKELKQELMESGIFVFEGKDEFFEVMRLEVDEISDLDAMTIVRYIYILSQYVAFLNQQVNFYKIKERKLQEEYNRLVLTLASEQRAKTLKERQSLAAEDPRVKKIEEKLERVRNLRESQSEAPKYHVEILNALKRFHSELSKHEAD